MPLISLFLIDKSVSDPVNVPKLFSLGVVASASFAVAVLFKFQMMMKSRITVTLVLIFAIFSFITLFTSESPFTQSLYGVYGRNNGFITYLFLILILLSALTLRNPSNYLKLTYGILLAGGVNLIYCSWVLIFGDFLSWVNPYGNILGTFGNPNFIGSFLGMCFGVLCTFIFSPGSNRKLKLFASCLIPPLLLVIYLSRAIQGRVLAVMGFCIVIFFWLRFSKFNKAILFAYSFSISIIGSFALAGAFQKGPLSELIYKRSVSLRGQYWLSGWNTGVENPWNGAGFDALGDWYRRMRDQRALELPGIDTVVNAAHNVPLDIFAFGGWPLFISYLVLFGYIGIVCLRFIANMRKFDTTFIALFVAWISYQMQSIISINQIGLATWGWVLSGALIGYVKTVDEVDFGKVPNKSQKKSWQSSNQSIVSPQLVSGIAIVIGGLIAVPPLAADIQWMSAQKSGSAIELEKTMDPSYMNPANSYKYLVNVQLFERSNLNDLAHKYALDAVKFNPNYYDGWRLLSILKNSSAQEKRLALKNMKRLDPKNPELR